MKGAIFGAVLLLAVVPVVEAQRRSTTNRDWLQWPQSERAAYFMGFADATSALAGLTCPSDATLAVGLTRAGEEGEENPRHAEGSARRRRPPGGGMQEGAGAAARREVELYGDQQRQDVQTKA